MSVRPCNRSPRTTRTERLATTLAGLLFAASGAHALGTDRQQPMDVSADYSKITQGSDKQPGTSYLRGNVRVVQGTLKASGAEATIHQKKSGEVARVVLTGKQAHIEQQQDGGGTMSADADRIDFDNDTGVAVLNGRVTVLQSGRGEFHGEKMTYNTNTGEMESGEAGSGGRVHMILQPKAGAKDGAKKDDAG